jgi:hypothetical protein
MQMSSHERLPSSPFLAYWWDFQPKAVQERGQLAFLHGQTLTAPLKRLPRYLRGEKVLPIKASQE